MDEVKYYAKRLAKAALVVGMAGVGGMIGCWAGGYWAARIVADVLIP